MTGDNSGIGRCQTTGYTIEGKPCLHLVVEGWDFPKTCGVCGMVFASKEKLDYERLRARYLHTGSDRHE